ncbi:hypothetical protein BDZ97DRAFT_280701 [Flammula alnicola]|nr:hypothetical protein BDZ97DRAFT_280701 [Flammula alnicola]
MSVLVISQLPWGCVRVWYRSTADSNMQQVPLFTSIFRDKPFLTSATVESCGPRYTYRAPSPCKSTCKPLNYAEDQSKGVRFDYPSCLSRTYVRFGHRRKSLRHTAEHPPNKAWTPSLKMRRTWYWGSLSYLMRLMLNVHLDCCQKSASEGLLGIRKACTTTTPTIGPTSVSV